MTKNKGTLVRLSEADLKTIKCAMVKSGIGQTSRWMRHVLVCAAEEIITGEKPLTPMVKYERPAKAILAVPACGGRCALLEPFIAKPYKSVFECVGNQRTRLPSSQARASADAIIITMTDPVLERAKECVSAATVVEVETPPKPAVRYTGVTWVRNGRKMWELERDNGVKFSTFDPPKR